MYYRMRLLKKPRAGQQVKSKNRFHSGTTGVGKKRPQHKIGVSSKYSLVSGDLYPRSNAGISECKLIKREISGGGREP